MTEQVRIRNPKGHATAKLDEHGLDALCAQIIEGDSYTDICRKLEIGKVTLVDWIAADSERSARVREADILSSRANDERALAVLQDEKIDVARAREIASHLRWRARVRNPREYGDKLQVDQTNRFEAMPEEALASRLAAIQKQIAEASSSGESQHEGGA